MLKVTRKALIEQEVIKNLLSAHKRIAASGNTKEVIRLSRFLFWLAKKSGNILIEAVSEEEKDR